VIFLLVFYILYIFNVFQCLKSCIVCCDIKGILNELECFYKLVFVLFLMSTESTSQSQPQMQPQESQMQPQTQPVKPVREYKPIYKSESTLPEGLEKREDLRDKTLPRYFTYHLKEECWNRR